MTEPEGLQAALGDLAAGRLTSAGLEVLRQAFASGRITLATGDRAVALGGDVTDAVVVTGDHNVIHVAAGPSVETVRQMLRAATGEIVSPVPRRPARVPFQVPPLPLHYVPRPEATEALKKHLLADGPRHRGVLVVGAIQGLGGIGKSTLAAAVAHDEDTARRFPDGVLWATLGQQPEILSLLSGWIQALGDRDFAPTVADAASAHLRTLLYDKAALLIADDAWSPEHVRAFLVGGPACRLLITTRLGDVADDVGADRYQLDVMTDEQALALLSIRLRRDLHASERTEAQRLAEAVGRLPLALELAAVRVSRGTSWTDLRAALKAETVRLEVLETPHRRRAGETRIEASFRLSLDALLAVHAHAYRAFVALGALPEDAQITAPMASILWDTAETEASEILEVLWNDALLLAGPPVQIADRTWPSYRLHDLLHDVARRLLPEGPPRGLGLDTAQAHTLLLERYRRRTRDGLWHTLPADGYIHSRLGWHMERASREEEIHRLLREETTDGRNGWYVACERLGQTTVFLEDVGRIWLRRRAAAESDGEAIGQQCRYALIIASLHSLADSLPSELLVALVRQGSWPAAQGLAYARQVPDPKRRARALGSLAPHLAEPLRERAVREAFASLQEVEREIRWATEVARLAPQLPADLLAPALARSSELREALARPSRAAAPIALSRLPPASREEALRQAAIAAQGIRGPCTRAEALTALVPHLPEPARSEVIGAALAAARAIPWPNQRAMALSRLAPNLPAPLRGEVLDEALETSRSIDSGRSRAEVLSILVPQLAEPQGEAILHEALAAFRAIPKEPWRAAALSRLVPGLPASWRDGVAREALAAAHRIDDRWQRDRIVSDLAPHLPEALLAEALAISRVIGDGAERAEVSARVGTHLPLALLSSALTAARSAGKIRLRNEALCRLAIRLAEAGRGPEALAVAQEVADDNREDPARTRALWEIASRLPEELLPGALAAARTLGRVSSMPLHLVPHLPESLREEVLGEKISSLVSQYNAGYGSHQRFSELAPHLSRRLLSEALGKARGIEYNRGSLLADLAPHLPQALWEDAVRTALHGGPRERPERRVYALTQLADSLPAGFLSEDLAREVLREIRQAGTSSGSSHSSDKAYALGCLVPHLEEPLRQEVLQSALAWAAGVEGIWTESKLLPKLAPYLSNPSLSRTLADACTGGSEQDLAAVLATTSLALAHAGRFAEAMAVARRIGKEGRSQALSELVPLLPEPLKKKAVRKALAAIKASPGSGKSAKALARLVSHLPEDRLVRALALARSLQDESGRIEVLIELAPRLPDPLGGEAWQGALAAAARRRWPTMLSVASRLPLPWKRSALLEVFAQAMRKEKDVDRVKDLAGLAVQLVELPDGAAYAMWDEMLPPLAGRGRRELLADLGALAPFLARLGGPAAIAETFTAVEEVGRWWP